MTEMERYSAKGYVGKAEKNKGAKKQEAWSESLQELTEKPGLDYHSRQILKRIAAQTNVPRKKPKFINFLKSSMRIDPRQSEAIWSIIEQNLIDFNNRMSAATSNGSQSTSPETESKSSTDSIEDHVFGAGYTNGSTNGTSTNGSNETISSKWAEILAYTLSQTTLDTPVRKALKKLQKIPDELENVEELKKKKFVKFVQQRLEVETDIAKSVWRAFDESRSALANSDQADTASTKSLKKRKHSENAIVDLNQSIKDKKKRTNCCDPDAEGDGDTGSGDGDDHSACDLNNSTFDWEKSISKVFKKHKSNNKLDLTFLKNKVLKKYSKENENEAAGARLSHIENKITKVIKKIDKFVVEDDIVKIREQ